MILVEIGYFLMSCLGLIGRFSNPPPQLGQTSCNKETQSAQNVHSNVHIIASLESKGKDLLQCSQVGLISNIKKQLILEVKN